MTNDTLKLDLELLLGYRAVNDDLTALVYLLLKDYRREEHAVKETIQATKSKHDNRVCITEWIAKKGKPVSL